MRRSLLWLIAALAYPSSSLLAQGVEFMWSGAATHESIQVKARLNSQRFVRLAVSESSDLSSPLISNASYASPANDFVVSLSVGGLKADTKYYYAISEANGSLNQPYGSFRTFPVPGCQVAYEFSIALGSDAGVGSNALVFQTIQAHDPNLFFHLGGLHYSDINIADISAYRSAYQTALTRPRQTDLYRNVSSMYIWDDHDFGPDDSDSTYIGRSVAKSAFLEYVPTHPLVSEALDHGIYRAFTLGRVRVIVTDARFHRSPKTAVDDSTKTMLGVTQKAWLKEELLFARDHYPLIIWINPVPWIEVTTAESDRWGGYSAERAELAQFIADNNIDDKLLMLSGDANMVAVDDGSYSGYAAAPMHAGFPVIHSSAFDRLGSYRGGPYRLGARPGTMHYGLLTLTDECADRVDAEFRAFTSLDEPVTSDTDFNLDNPVVFRHSYLSGGEILVHKGAIWRYRDDGELPSADWASPNYLDTGWKSGPAQLGYGDVPDGKVTEDVATEIEFGFQPQFKHITYYFRTYFEIANKADIKGLIANLLVDDGAVIYINGFEIARINLPSGIITPDSLAESPVEGADEATFNTVDLSAAVGSLFNGTNVLAVEVHQESASSPDLSFDVELFGVTSEIAANIKPVAMATVTPLSGDAPLEVTFDASESFDIDGSIVSYSWTFGDGVSSGQPVIAHTYSSVGTFEAVLSVTDNLGRIDTATFEIEVTNAPPEPVIIADPMTGETPLRVDFDGSSSSDPNGTIVSYKWWFGTGDSADGERVSYIYETPGSFWAKLAVTDNLGDVGKDSVLLEIAQGNLPPEAIGLPVLDVPEDTSTITITLRDYFDDDRDPDEALIFTMTSVTNDELFSSINFDDVNDVLAFTPAPDLNGFSEFVLEVFDSMSLSTVDTLRVTVAPVNDPPSFTPSGSPVVTTDTGLVSFPDWAADLIPGPPDETGQALAFTASVNRPELFLSLPEISPEGTLSFEPATDTSGLSQVALVLRDDGGTDRGGIDSIITAFSILTNHRPAAEFSFVRHTVGSLAIDFDASASFDRDGAIVTYRWEFGDGTTGEGVQVTHDYTEVAVQDVRLTVIDDLGASSVSESSVAVNTEEEALPTTFSVGSFYPNPVGSMVNLDIALPEHRDLTVSFVDMTGRVVHERETEGRAGYRRFKFDTSSFPAGMYLVQIKSRNEVTVRRLTVVR